MTTIRLDETTGTLSLLGTGQIPVSFPVGNSDRFIFQPQQPISFSAPNSPLLTYRFDPLTGNAIQVSQNSTSEEPWHAFTSSQDGHCLFAFANVTDPSGGMKGLIASFAIGDDGTLSLTGSPFQATTGSAGSLEWWLSMRSTRVGHFLFTAADMAGADDSAGTVIGVINIGADGSLTALPEITDAFCGPCGDGSQDVIQGFGVTADARFAIVSKSLSGFHVYSISNDGHSSEISGSPFNDPFFPGAFGELFLAGSHYVYAMDSSNHIFGFAVGEDGSLTPLQQGRTIFQGQPTAVSWSGNFLITVQPGGGAIDAFRVHDDGTLEFKSALAVTAFFPFAAVPGS